ncbi:glycoside hydrolase family 47 protein, partial [Conidiobolus coronatus NRRL 28638]
RREEVKAEFVHAWTGYKTYAFGQDELHPISNTADNSRFQGWGLTIVDSLSTLWLLDLKQEFQLAVQRIAMVDFTQSAGPVLVFETTIRYLGGLLSAYDLSGEPILLQKAVQLADSLLPAFNTPTGFPYYRYDFTRKIPDANRGIVILAEIGSVQMEFVRLSQLTNNPTYAEVVMRIYERLFVLPKPRQGLYPVYLNVFTGQFITQQVSFGALGDSFYEYLLKVYIMTGKSNPLLLSMFQESMQGLKSLMRRGPNGELYFGEIDQNGQYQQYMDHLTFFVPGLLQYANHHIPGTDYGESALHLMDTCYNAYRANPYLLGPEVVSFSQTTGLSTTVPTSNLRPEMFESLYYSYYYTKDPKYREMAYAGFKAIRQHSKTPSGFACYNDITNSTDGDPRVDVMESFFLAETLKYLYLIFSDQSTLNLDQWVFNTEAHPFR